MIRGETDHYDYVCGDGGGGHRQGVARHGSALRASACSPWTTWSRRWRGPAGASATGRGCGSGRAAGMAVELQRRPALTLDLDCDLADDDQPLQRHADAADRRHAPGDGRGRGGGRAALADPTVQPRSQERVAELLGHEAGLFLPSGTMCNEIAFRLHIRPGRRRDHPRDRNAHPIVAEAGGPAALAGAMISRSTATRGMFTRRRSWRRRSARRPLRCRARGSCRSSRRRTSAAAASGRSSRSRACSRSRASTACAPTWTARG